MSAGAERVDDGRVYSHNESEAAFSHAVRDSVLSAYPWVAHLPAGTVVASGMTLRDYFAAKAMAALIATENYVSAETVCAADAYLFADAMLAARVEPQS